MAGIGLFMIGSGGDAAVNMCFNFLGEVVEDETRQKFSVIMQPWFAFGACVLTATFIFVDNWSIAVAILLTGPSSILLFFIIIYIE